MHCYCLLLLLLLLLYYTSNKFESIKHNITWAKSSISDCPQTYSHELSCQPQCAWRANHDQRPTLLMLTRCIFCGCRHCPLPGIAGRLTGPSHTVSGDDACTCADWSRLAAPTLYTDVEQMWCEYGKTAVRSPVSVFVHPHHTERPQSVWRFYLSQFVFHNPVCFILLQGHSPIHEVKSILTSASEVTT